MRERPDVKGSIHFSLKDLRANRLGVKDRLTKTEYQRPALIPEMPWLAGTVPKKPTNVDLVKQKNGTMLTIADPKNEHAAYYAIYRFDGQKAGSLESNENLIATVRKDGQETTFIDHEAAANQTYTYVITALDRLHNESKNGKKAKQN